MAVADPARDPGVAGGGLAEGVRVEVDNGGGLPAGEFGGEGAALRAGGGGLFGGRREADETGEQGVAFQEGAHRFAGDEDEGGVRELRAERLQAGGGDEHIANTVRTAEEEGGQKG